MSHKTSASVVSREVNGAFRSHPFIVGEAGERVLVKCSSHTPYFVATVHKLRSFLEDSGYVVDAEERGALLLGPYRLRPVRSPHASKL